MTTALPSKAMLEKIRLSIQNALEGVAKEHNLEDIKLGAIHYDESGFRVPVEAVFQGGESKDTKNLRLVASNLGFTQDIVNAKISYGNKEYYVVGAKRTNLVLKEVKTQRNYVAKADFVLLELQRQKSPFVLEKKSVRY